LSETVYSSEQNSSTKAAVGWLEIVEKISIAASMLKNTLTSQHLNCM